MVYFYIEQTFIIYTYIFFLSSTINKFNLQKIKKKEYNLRLTVSWIGCFQFFLNDLLTIFFYY